MLAVTDADVFVVLNTIMQRYPKKKQPKLYYGLASYFATSPQREHAIVLDATLMFTGVSPTPQQLVTDGEIDLDLLDAYLETNPKKHPTYKWQRPNIIDAMIKKAESDDKHALSAMLSNFTPAARPAVKGKVIEFLLNGKAKHFTLPEAMQPKRGRAVEYYLSASQADYTDLKADIAKDRPDTFDGRYWKAAIAKEAKKANKDGKA